MIGSVDIIKVGLHSWLGMAPRHSKVCLIHSMPLYMCHNGYMLAFYNVPSQVFLQESCKAAAW